MTKDQDNEKVSAALDTTIIFPKKSVLMRLAKEKRDARQKTQAISGEYGNSIAQAVEKDHLDRKAFSIAMQLDGMSDERLHITFHSLLNYMDELGITKRATAQEELFANGEDREPAGRFSDAGETNGSAPKNESGEKVAKVKGPKVPKTKKNDAASAKAGRDVPGLTSH